MNEQPETNELNIKKRCVISWSYENDIQMLKEVAAEGILHYKVKSRERGAGWATIAEKVKISMPGLDISPRAVRDRFNTLVRKRKAANAEEHRATGIGGTELSEKETLIEDLMEIASETEKIAVDENEEKKQMVEKEKQQAVEMRRRAMETFGETRKRIEEQSGKTGRKRKRSGESTMEWIKEKSERNKEMMEKKMEEKRAEREDQRESRMIMIQTMQTTQMQMQQQFDQQQQQSTMLQQQMLAMIQQQQQQTQLLAECFRNITEQ